MASTFKYDSPGMTVGANVATGPCQTMRPSGALLATAMSGCPSRLKSAMATPCGLAAYPCPFVW